MKPSSIVIGVAQAMTVAFFATGALAQPVGQPGAAPKAGDSIVAHLKKLEGNVLVSQPSGLAAGSEGLGLRSGIRVITAANSKAVVRYEDGCEVTLEPNQRLVVDDTTSCKARMLQAQSTLPQQSLATTTPVNGGLTDVALGGGLQSPLAGVVSGAVGVYLYLEARRDSSSNPNFSPVSPN